MLTKSSDRLLKIVDRLASWHWLHNAQLEPIEPKAVLEANAQRSNFPPVPITPGLRRTAYSKSWMSWIWTAVRTVNLESPSLCSSMVLTWTFSFYLRILSLPHSLHFFLAAEASLAREDLRLTRSKALGVQAVQVFLWGPSKLIKFHCSPLLPT